MHMHTHTVTDIHRDTQLNKLTRHHWIRYIIILTYTKLIIILTMYYSGSVDSYKAPRNELIESDTYNNFHHVTYHSHILNESSTRLQPVERLVSCLYKAESSTIKDLA